jgi:hypothetical protein
VNGYTFYIKAKDKKGVAQNSGINIEAFDPHRLKATYYGYIGDIWELDYADIMQILIFKCQWAKHLTGVNVDYYRLTYNHMVISEKQRIVGVESVKNGDEDYNHYE